MEKLDPKQQERVWQRVRGEQPAPPQEQMLMSIEAETIAQLQALIKYYPGKAQELRKILTQTQDHLACLQGMCLLRQGIKPPRPTGRARNTDPIALARKCYVNCIDLATKYTTGAEDPECGLVYAELAQSKRRHCTQLLSLLGSRNK